GPPLVLQMPVAPESRDIGRQRSTREQPEQRGIGLLSAAQVECTATGESARDGHAVFGEGSGLVRTDYADGAERFDSRQLADERMALQHALAAQGQRDDDHGGEPLGNRGYREADGGQEERAPILAASQSGGEDDGHNGEGCQRQLASETIKEYLQMR